MLHDLEVFCKAYTKSGIIRAFYVLVKDNVDKLAHLEGTKVLFCDLQHTTLASDLGAKHTICLSVIDQVHGYHIKDYGSPTVVRLPVLGNVKLTLFVRIKIQAFILFKVTNFIIFRTFFI